VLSECKQRGSVQSSVFDQLLLMSNEQSAVSGVELSTATDERSVHNVTRQFVVSMDPHI